jgi:hypothetical protein
MRLQHLHSALRIGVLVGIVGCSGAQLPGTPAQNASFNARAAAGGHGTVSPSYPVSKTLLFEGAYAGGSDPWLVNVYDASKITKNPAPIATITDAIDAPQQMATDSSGTLYVVNQSSSTVTEYPPGQTTHSVTISDGLNEPWGLVIDSKGTLYVCNASTTSNGPTGYVTEYAAGSQSPSVTITGFNGDPAFEALDKHENLFIGWYYQGAYDVVEVPKGTTNIKHLNLQGLKSSVSSLAFDEAGRLWLTEKQTAQIYKLPSTKPIRTIRDKQWSYPSGLFIVKTGSVLNGTVLIGSSGTPKVGPAVFALKENARTPYARLNNSVFYPYALLVAKQ